LFNVSLSSAENNYTLKLQIFRGWTPSKGGGKGFNKQMSFNVTIPIKIF
jgi:hypothetical protein